MLLLLLPVQRHHLRRWACLKATLVCGPKIGPNICENNMNANRKCVENKPECIPMYLSKDLSKWSPPRRGPLKYNLNTCFLPKRYTQFNGIQIFLASAASILKPFFDQSFGPDPKTLWKKRFSKTHFGDPG